MQLYLIMLGIHETQTNEIHEEKPPEKPLKSAKDK
jgi:hypothetical protein